MPVGAAYPALRGGLRAIPDYIAQSQTKVDVATTTTVAKPASTKINDTLVMAIVKAPGGSNSPPWPTPPAGWTLQETLSYLRIYTKVATATEPANYSFATPQGAGGSIFPGLIHILLYRPTKATGPVDVHANRDLTTSSLYAPSVNATGNGRIITFFALSAAVVPSSVSIASMRTLRAMDITNDNLYFVADDVVATSLYDETGGATGQRFLSGVSGSVTLSTVTLVLKSTP